MILSVSRRTDIPAHYAEWFFNRIRDGFVLVRNPMNFHHVSRINIKPDAVDGIVFWTKDPTPMLPRLGELARYHYYFQFTLNSYAVDVEPGVGSKAGRIIPAFKRLSDMIGPERVIWRYDPILINEKYTSAYHIKYFERLARSLRSYTKKCVFSFIDLYRSTRKDLAELSVHPLVPERKSMLAKSISDIASSYELCLESCAEDIPLEYCGVAHGRCVDADLLGKISGRRIEAKRDKNQRTACGCAESVDIGMYGTCPSGCRYCYANRSMRNVARNVARHDPVLPLLCGEIGPGDSISERKTPPCRRCRQGNIFS